jgi:hypothetical protein
MITDTILSDLDEASDVPSDPAKIAIWLDHSRRIVSALAGFRVYGGSWLRPWMTYCASPILSRVAPAGIAHFTGFNARLGECDLYTFANVFADYPIDDLARALPEVELIVDLGANVGAFSFLMRTLCRKIGCNPRIVALEPDASKCRFPSRATFCRRSRNSPSCGRSFERNSSARRRAELRNPPCRFFRQRGGPNGSGDELEIALRSPGVGEDGY